ncbi:hypothetical protein [Klebsiella michiganensis]|uniref:hypothetical protein n=1 Tax=Klebsiella michiganensis TaxID=1134687 RepID=UPI00117A43F6|nr:hypothetical protein [Klebsiella michiganensis]TRW41688.1 hypothetical protein FNL49_01845 [Klebsiella michiganensis]TRW42535.1 hypothetical protein FNL50_01845 [Klebsiella michiganensis]
MSTSHSENWAFLLKLLTENSGKGSYSDGNLSRHQQAYALALFLVDAVLATPELNRCNVDALIAGELSWPCSEGTDQFPGSQYSLSFFENGGFISFPGGWVDVHCCAPQQAKKMDQSIEDVLRVTNILKNINFGWEGYLQPHFVMDKDDLVSLIDRELGNIHLDSVLPSIVDQQDVFAIYPEKQQFSQLESTYLWQCLLRRHPPKNAFSKWMLCLRVLNHSIVPVQFSLLDKSETDQFLFQVELLVQMAPEFNYSFRTIFKQAVNSYSFTRLIQPVSLEINIDIGSESIKPDITYESEEPSPLEIRTAETLDGAYHFPDMYDPAEIISKREYQHLGDLYAPLGTYSWLIQECFDHVIFIDHNSLTAKPFALSMLSLAKTREALQYLLFIGLPIRFNRKYILFLLSNPETCEIAIYHLTSPEYPLPSPPRLNVSNDLNQLFFEIIAREYFRTIEDRSDNGLRLLNVCLYLADNSGLYRLPSTDGLQYKTLLCFMHQLEDKYVALLAKAFLETIPLQYEWRISHIRERSVYHIGLWLIQRLEYADISYHELLPQLGEYLTRFYSRAFQECITTRRRDLKSDSFFALLPWQSLIKITGLNEILRLSMKHESWSSVLIYENDRCFDSVSAIRQYLQLLMLISKASLEQNDRVRTWHRIINIVYMHGFGHEEGRCYLFGAVINDEATDLLKTFGLFVNVLPPSYYDEFTERCIDIIPLDSLYILLERCNIHERKQVIHQAILDRQNLSDEQLGLKSLETAFIHACEHCHMELAAKVLSSARPILERLRGNSHIQCKEIICRWETYNYKYTLLSAYLSGQEDPQTFERIASGMSLPNGLTGMPENEIARRYRRDCAQFLRYIIATAFCQIEPSKTVQYMEALCTEANAPHFAYTLFKGHIAALSGSQNTAALRQALNKFLMQTSSISPDQMATGWVAIVLEVMIQVGDQQQADEYWRKLTGEQRRTQEILLPYCKGLIQRGQALVASQIINEFTEFNRILSENDVELTELVTHLSQALPGQNSTIEIFRAMAESNQRSIEQLRQHYLRITGGSFEDYVEITGSGYSKEMFLKNIIAEVAGEVLLRKKNLQSQQSTNGQLNKLIHEDLINDWFTSLVDMRMAEARIGFHDQKRTGSSASGKSPGESDGLITNSKNRRIAIFEAFRLFSLDKTVISDHLNKIVGYDAEALSPVFMVAYCDVPDFIALTTGYYTFISETDYAGYKKNGQIAKVDDRTTTDNLWTCTETRLRGGREVIFCHFLLNMHCN